MKLTRRKAMKEKNRKNMKRIRERVEKKKKNEKIERRWNKVEEGKTKKRTKKRMGVAVEEEKDVKEMGMKKTYKRVVNEEESEKEKDDNTKPVPSDCTSDHEFQGGSDGSSSVKKRFRSRTSFVWSMVYEMDADAECLICGKRIRSSCATNITAHMARKHPHELVAGCIATGKKKITPVTLRTRTRSMLHAASVETVECSTTEENRQYEITKLLALAVATSSSPIALVDNTLFREYSSRIPHFKPPNATNVTKAIKSEYGALVDRMKKTLANIDVLAVSVNISLPAIDSPSSDRSLVSVIADFFDPEQETFAHHLLDVVNLQKEHTSDYLMECVRTVMETYGITHKVFRFICSGGSMTRTVLAEPFKYTIANRSDDQQPLDVSNMSNEQLEQLVIKPEYGGDTQMLTASDDVVPMEFFASIDSHIPSALQTLMVVLRECFEENLFMQKLSVYVFEVLKLFTQSATLMKELILETGGKKLLFPGNTSWLTLFIAYRRFLEIFSSMDLVFTRHRITALLTPPLLQRIVEVVCEKLMCPEIGAIAASLRESLKIHFAEVLHSGECGSDPIYILSTFLDRKTAFLLSNVRKATAIAVTKKMIRLANAISIANDRQEEVKEEGTFLESPYISLISHAIRERERAPLESTCDNVSEVEKYAAIYITWPSDENFTNGFDFWRQQKHQFPNLYVLASMCFCVPAAVSSNVTPMFAQFCTLQSISHRSDVNAELFRERVMLTFNQNLLRL